MGKILTFGPLTLFAYQIFLASTGKSPLTVFNLVPHQILTAALDLLQSDADANHRPVLPCASDAQLLAGVDDGAAVASNALPSLPQINWMAFRPDMAASVTLPPGSTHCPAI